MKRIIIIAAILLGASTYSVKAQNLLDALKGVASAAIEQVAGGKLTAVAMIGTWHYNQPGIKLSSDDTVSELAASAVTSSIQAKLDTYYQKVGIKSGTCSFTFNQDGTFSSTFGKKTASGTYTFDTESSMLTLQYTTGRLKLGTIPAYAYMNGDKLQIVFPVDKLANLLVSLGSKVNSLAPLTTLLHKYNSVKIGFEFSK